MWDEAGDEDLLQQPRERRVSERHMAVGAIGGLSKRRDDVAQLQERQVDFLRLVQRAA